MGCATSKADPPPGNAPPEWKAELEEVFKLLDKNGTGFISTVPHKKREDVFSEINVLGDAVVDKQLAMGDFAMSTAVSLADWIAACKAKAEEKTWEPVGELLAAIKTAVSDADKGGVEMLARGVFKNIDSKFCEPPETGKVAFPKELEAMAGETDKKAATLMAGLETDTQLECEAWVTHVLAKVELAGWPRAKKELKSIQARVDKISELDAMDGM